MHVFWVTKEQLLQVPKMKTQLSSFLKRNPEKWDMDETCVDEDYTQIERIVAHKKDGSLNLYLVKWKSLGYEEATWEYESEIKVYIYHTRSTRPNTFFFSSEIKRL